MPRVPRIICPGMPVMPGYSRIRRQIPVMAPAAPGAAGRTWAAVASCPAGPLANAAPAVSAVTEITATPMTAAILVAFTPRPGPRCRPGSRAPAAGISGCARYSSSSAGSSAGQAPGRGLRSPEHAAQPALRQPPVAERMAVDEHAGREQHARPGRQGAAVLAGQVDLGDLERMVRADPGQHALGVLTQRAVGLGQQRDRGHDGCSPAFMSASIVVVGRNIVYFGAPP